MVARHDIGEIFLGVTPKPVRDYLRLSFDGALREGYSRLVIPCVGRFTVAEAAIDAGWPADRLELSDISLFSAIVGGFITGQKPQDLGLAFHDEFDTLHPWLDREEGFAAVLVALKLCQLRQDRVFEGMVRKHIRDTFAAAVEDVHGKLGNIKARLAGARYESADVMKIVEATAPDPDAVLYINPPSYARGYSRMFDTRGLVTWNVPSIPEFDAKKSRAALHSVALAAETPALCFVFRGRYIEQADVHKAVFAAQKKGNDTDYVLTNRPDEAAALSKPRRETKIGSAGLAFLPEDHVITLEARIAYREVTKGQALYYRDLFAHKLGVTRAERYFVALLDGYLMAVFGMFFSEVQRGVSGKVYETFGFTVPNKRYPRLNRLFMTSIVCEDARLSFQAHCAGAIRDVDYFQTTCISTTPEQKTHRGSLKLHLREKLPDGRFKLVYGGPFKPWGFGQVVANWFDRMKNVEQETGKSMGVAA